MIVIGFYTNARYKTCWREHLGPSLKEHGLKSNIVPYNRPDNWFSNTRLKVGLIRWLMQLYDPEPVLYLDVDARVRAPLLDLEDIKEDLALTCWENNGTRPPEFLTGTMLVRSSPAMKGLLDSWERLNAEHPKKLEQQNLQLLLETTYKDRITVKKLGPEYCWIEPAMRHFHPDMKPVIEHLQLSRPMWERGKENNGPS